MPRNNTQDLTFFAAVTALWMIVTLAPGCAMFKIRDRNDVEVAKIHRAAIVAMTVDEPASAQLTLSLNSGNVEGTSGGSMISKYDDHAEEMYDSLRTELAKNTGWQITDKPAMIAKPGYQTAYDSTMKGWQSKMPPGEGRQHYLIHAVMDADGPRILGAQGRDTLMEALGVDSIIVATVRVELTGTTIMGLGSRYPKSLVSFQVYAKGQERPVWFDGGVEGEVASESVGATRFYDESALGRIAAKSATTAFRKIGNASKL